MISCYRHHLRGSTWPNELRKDDATSQIPIVMISAIGQTMGMDHAKELGSEFVPAEKFLDKPLKADTVLAAVWETLAARGTAPGD